MEDLIIGLVKDVAVWVFSPITERISVVYHYSSNVKELKEKETELETKMETVLHAVEEADRQGDRIEKHVQEWLKKAGDFTERLAKITNKDEEDKKKKRCFKGLRCLNLKMRYRQSKEAVKLAADVDGLLTNADFPRVSYRTLPERRKSMYVREDDTFDSRESIFKEIMETLGNATFKIIGVYGTGGVGKTTLVKKVYWQAKEDKLFDQVVMAEITQNPDLKKIQGEIAGHLGLVFQEESVEARAARLRERLEKEKRVLVILDNVWVELDLAAVGIPLSVEKVSSHPTRDLVGRKEDQRQCRILLTCRDLKVCKFMNTEKNISVMPLSSTEALDLFWRIVDHPTKQSEFESIGAKIVEKCGGLPVAIKTIAKTLKHEGRSIWDDAQSQLVNFKFSGVGEDFYSVIELSYNFLRDEEAKLLFLLCGLHAAGASIGVNYLVKYVMGLGSFHNANTLEDVRGRVDNLIRDLKDASLLLDDDDSNDIVKVHDVIHMVARRIGARSRDKPMFNIQDVKNVKEELGRERYKYSDAISIPFMDISELPEMPEFPQIQLLLLFMNDHSLKIPEHFFEKMKELKVLDLTSAHLPSLTSTLCYLANLRTLCLERCQLGDITMVGNLTKLEVLSFCSSDIKKLPEEIGGLTQLKSLDLQSCSQLEVIPPNVLSKLTRLEELSMGDGFVGWDVKGRDNASLVELTRLYNLTSLRIHVKDAQIMPQDIFPKNLLRYVIFIGDVWDWSDKYESSRVLKLKLNDSNFLVYGAKMLLKKTEDLYLDKLNGFRNVHPELGGDGFQDLKHLRVQNDPDILHIVKEEVWDIYNAFLGLKSLLLHNLINLKEIYHGQLRAGSFGKLKMIKVEKCDALMHLISYSTAKTFIHLEKLEVVDCKILKEIVNKKSEEDDIQTTEIEFSELHSLTLKCLPEFKSFGPAASMRTHGSVQENDHETLMTAFGKKVSFPSLRNLNLSSLNIGGIWLDQFPLTSSFGQSLTSLVVNECNGLRFVFSSSTVKCLQQLQNLEIANCESMVEIINTDGLGENGSIEILLPNLLYLELQGLATLTRFCSANLVNFPSLKRLWIETCPNLKKFISSSTFAYKTTGKEPKSVSEMCNVDILLDEKVVLPALEELKLSSINNGRIWNNQLFVESADIENLTSGSTNHGEILGCKSLKSLKVENCSCLEYLFTLSMVLDLVHLEELIIENCTMMKEVIIREEGKDASDHQMILPKLNQLHLKRLPALQRFYNSNGIFTELSSLSDLAFYRCPNIQTFISSSMEYEEGNSGQNLTTETIPLFDEKVILPSLKFLEISRMDNLRKIWQNTLNVNSFCSIQKIRIYGCDNLLTVFPLSMLGRLQRLETLKVYCCDLLGEIFEVLQTNFSLVENVIGDCAVPRLPFAKLTSLKLWVLPTLRSFCQGLHISEWPNLKKLVVCGCDNVEIFASEFLSLHNEILRKKESEISIPQPLFILDKVAFPSLEELKFVWNDILKEIWHGKFLEYPCKLKVFKLKKNPEIRSFPSYFLNTLPNLEKLVIHDASYKELYLCSENGDDRNKSKVLNQFRDFRLQNMPELLYLWKEGSPASIIFQNMASLKVSECGCLDSLIPPSVSFLNLTALEISNCNGLINVVTVSTAASIVQLTRLSIIDCEMLEEIITSTGDEVKEQLVFRQLQFLGLNRLPNLNGFYLGNNTLEFPSLEQVVVSCCPKLKVFSRGISITGKLQRVQHTGEKDEWFWKLDLNNTIQTMFDEMVGFRGLKELRLSKFPRLKEMWHCQIPVNVFCKLKSLVVDECEYISNAIPTDLLGSLNNLEKLEVRDCPSLEAVFDLEESNVDGRAELLSDLSEFCLVNLPMLRRIQKSNFGVSLCFKSLKIFKIQNCSSLEYLFTWSVVMRLEHLEKMEIENCAIMKEIIADEGEKDASVDKVFFPKLHRLYLKHLPELKRFCNSNGNPIQLSSLSDVWIYHCPNMQSFVYNSISTPLKMQPEETNPESFHADIIPFFNEKATLPNLETMTLSCMDSLTQIWQNTEDTNSFGSLRWLQIHKCKNISNIFPPSMVGRLQSLGTLKLLDCDLLEQIFEVHETSPSSMEKVVGTEELGIGSFPKFLFPKLTSLKLSMLPRLRFFYPGPHVSEWPMLKELVVYNCKEVEIFGSEFMSLQIDSDWKNQPEISNPQPLFVLDKVAFPSLEGLDLSNMPKLSHLWKEDYKPCQIFPSLITMKLSECGNLKILVPSSVSFPNLTTLEVLNCVRLINLVSSSTAKSLVQLTRVNVNDCREMQECIIHNEEKERDLIVLRKLEYLGLHCLPSLASFCSGNCDFEFPSLAQVTTKQCPNLKIFSTGVLSTPKLQSIQLAEEDETFWETGLNTTIEHLFRELAGFHGLEHLRIAKFPHLKERWPAQIPVRIFCNLKSLEVSDCTCISNAIPSNLLESLNTLEKLDVRDCASLEAVFDLEEPNTDGCTELLSNFSELCLVNLPRLRHIQNSNLNLQLCFKSLKILKVQNCSSLEYLFTWSVVMRLEHLKKIEIENCAIMKEIIEGEKDASVDKVIFPKLHRLYLKHLPELKRFCNSNGNPIQLSSLSDVWIYNCPNMQSFISSSISAPLTMQPEETNPESFHAEIIPFFNEKATLPNLETMTLSCMDSLMQIWQNTEDTNSFGSLRWLQIHTCKNVSNIFPSSMIGRLQSLGSLKVINCDLLEEIFEVHETSPSSMEKVGGAEELGIGAFPKFSFPKLTSLKLSMLPRLRFFYPGLHVSEWPMLKELVVYNCKELEIFAAEFTSLRIDSDWKNQPEISNPQPLFILDKVAFPSLEGLDLSNLPKLSHLWKEDYKPCQIFPSLITMKLSECGNLKILVPSSVSFPNLTTLEVLNCVRLINLVSSSTAKSLVQLTRVNVSDCQVMQECIIHNEEKERDLIVLRKLEYLGLHCLPSLASFCSGNCDFEFPSLAQVTTKQCPNLKIFSTRVVSTPKLQSIQLAEEDEIFWETDLNTTIQHLFRELAGFRSLERLRIAEFPHLKERWPAQIPVRIFCKLKSLEVSDCTCISNAIPSNLLESLNTLEKLDVRDCASLETVFDLEEPNTDGCTELLSNFSELCLVNLPRLRHIQNSNLNLQLCFKSLKILKVQNCSILEYLFTWSVVMRLEHLEKIEIENCAIMKEIIANEGEKDASVDKVIFPKLHRLYLKHLPELKRFCNSNGNPIQLSSLSDVWIYNCPNMQSFISSSISAPLTMQPEETNPESFHAEIIPFFNEKATLPNLEIMTLSCMDSLTQIWQNTEDTNSYGSLQWLQIHKCKNISNIFPPSMVGRLQSLGSLKVLDCDLLEEIFEVLGTSSLSVEKVFGNEELGIGAFPKFIFPKLTSLKLSMLPKLRFFYRGLHISEWPMLKELVVYNCREVEIFASEFSHVQNRCDWKKQSEISIPQPLFVLDKVAFPSLEGLELFYMPKLLHLWMENSQSYEVCPRLVTMKVSQCNNLKILVPASVSFPYLRTLEVSSCGGLVSLLSLSTAKSLVEVTRINVSNCITMEEIIKYEGDEEKDHIIFRQLQYLGLHCLLSLTGFHLGDHAFTFPSLEQLIVRQCPNINAFSQGVVSTPKLQKVKLTEGEDEWRWESDLHTTIKLLFKEMVGFRGLGILELSKFPQLKEICHGQIPVSYFSSLRSLIVDECTSIASAIPVNLLPFLCNLTFLFVKGCDSLEEVFDLEESSANGQFGLPSQLNFFCLTELPRLRNIWNKSHLEILGFINLKKMYVGKCSGLQYIFTTTVILSLVQLQEMTVRDCAMVEEIIKEDREKDATMNDIIVPLLNFIFLESLPNMTSFYSGNNVLGCPSLKNITLMSCPKMKTFAFTECLDLHDPPLIGEKVAFPSLEVLNLSNLPGLVHLWTEPSKVSQNLTTLKISECGSLKSLLPSLGALWKLMTLEVGKCHALASLVGVQTAKSLENLTRINITDCKMIKEIITRTGDEGNDQVVLTQLNYVGFHCLPSITGFYLGDCTIGLPSLEQVVVRQCTNMKTFCQGVLSTPKLQKVQITESEDKWHWDGDLNTTIQQLSKKRMS